MKTKEVNKTLVEFWNQAISLTDEDKIAIKKEIPNINDLAPSKKLYDEVVKLGKLDKVLDYGCGSGWASIIASMSGTKEVVAVDMGEAIIDALKFYSELYNLNNIKALTIDEKWLDTINDNTFDGVVCSNVLDVLPLETSRQIIVSLARITKSKVVIGLNFYLSPKSAKDRGLELVDDRYLFVNGVLRLNSLSDTEWEKEFMPYFDIEKLDYFAWPNESVETRRLFILTKK